MSECWTTKDQLAQLDSRLLQATRVIRLNPVFIVLIVNFVAALLPVTDVSSSVKISRLEQTLRL